MPVKPDGTTWDTGHRLSDADMVAGYRPVLTVAGRYHRPAINASAAFAFDVSDFRLWLVHLPPGTIRKVCLSVSTAGDASSRLRPVIYRPDGTNGTPGTLVVDGGQLDTSTTGIKEHVVPNVVWRGGPVWVGAHLDAGTAPSIAYCTQTPEPQLVSAANLLDPFTSTRIAWAVGTFPQGPAPAQFTAGGYAEASPPIVAVECYP